jgi:hypothetical protein
VKSNDVEDGQGGHGEDHAGQEVEGHATSIARGARLRIGRVAGSAPGQLTGPACRRMAWRQLARPRARSLCPRVSATLSVCATVATRGAIDKSVPYTPPACARPGDRSLSPKRCPTTSV